jgi:hypothetical protein
VARKKCVLLMDYGKENVGRGKICSLGKICVPNDGGRDGAKEKTL